MPDRSDLARRLEDLAEALGGEPRVNPEGGRSRSPRTLADVARDAGLPALESVLRCAPPRKRLARAERDAVAAFTAMPPADIPDDMLLGMMLSGEGGPPLQVARAILDELGGSLKRVLEPDMVRPVAGVAPVDAARLAASVELARRANVRDTVARTRKYRTSADVVALLRSMALGPVESLVAIYLSVDHDLLATRALTRGTETMTVVPVSIIIGTALRFGAAAIILAHNHPAGGAQPSQADRDVTARIRVAARNADMQLVDHIIVTEQQHYSMQEKGDFPPRR